MNKNTLSTILLGILTICLGYAFYKEIEDEEERSDEQKSRIAYMDFQLKELETRIEKLENIDG